MKTALLLTALMLTAPLAQAADKLIFACTAANGKQIRVTEHAGKFRYQFGKPNSPELVFENRRQEAIERSPRWNGIGRYIWTNLALDNGQYRYTVYQSMDRLTDEHGMTYGVVIGKLLENQDDTKHISDIECSGKHKIVANLPEELMF